MPQNTVSTHVVEGVWPVAAIDESDDVGQRTLPALERFVHPDASDDVLDALTARHFNRGHINR